MEEVGNARAIGSIGITKGYCQTVEILMNLRSREGILLLTLALPCFATGIEGQRSVHKVPGVELAEKPIAVGGGEVGDLLRRWYSKGTAAGNVGDYYDNRDKGHSRLKMDLYPQLQMIEYTEEEIRAGQNYGLQTKILPNVVFGNSSTSAPPERSGSNVRSYYSDPRGIQFLFQQYARNNLYIYPEHRDHDPGHNGIDGYGDLFPTNTPYVIVSQGSSGSDRPFMQMLPYVLAAFRPEVKRKLIESGLLIPTIQMIMRITSKHLESPDEYLTGKAHPTVFEGRYIDTKKMIEMAHEITLSSIPPIVVLNVIEEDTPLKGVDYFEPELTEHLADTPAVIARVFRGSNYFRKITVSAEQSGDINNRPLRFYWAVLRGDPHKIRIEYLNDSHSVARITVPYFDRYPIAEGASLESNRVDIGAFVHNGIYYSPPAFITYYTLDSEIRTYDEDRRPLEIAYDTSASIVSIADWSRFFRTLDGERASWADRFLREQFKSKELTALRKISHEYQKIHADRIAAEEKHRIAAAAQESAKDFVKMLKTRQAAADKAYLLKQNEETRAALDAASEELAAAIRTLDKTSVDAKSAREEAAHAKELEKRTLEENLPGMRVGAEKVVQKVLDSMIKDPNLWVANEEVWKSLYSVADVKAREEFDKIKDLLVAFGIAENIDSTSFRLKPILQGDGLLFDRLTRYEMSMIEQLNAALLGGIAYPGILQGECRQNFVDYRIASFKKWRDVYRYAPDGTPLGWRRYQGWNISEFNAEGLLVQGKDSRGRCIKARVVRYELEPQRRDGNGRIIGPYMRNVEMVPTDTQREYEYDGADDWKGRIKLP
jgi:hypothetical protein